MEMERRERVRLMPESPTFVAVRPEFAKLGRLLDITVDGLCFQYMAQVDLEDNELSFDIDMFLDDNGFYIQRIPCKSVYDTVIKDLETLPKGMELRRCGLRFNNLNREHIDSLALFIKEHTA